MRQLLLLRTLLLTALISVAAAMVAQVPIIDYGFQAVPPSVQVHKIVELPDGKILVGGFFLNYAGSGKNHLVRLNSDGTVDATWGPDGVGPSNSVYDIALMPDGRILIAGNFVAYNGISCQFIARLNANGTQDMSFLIPPNTINGAVNAIALHDDRKVIAVGDFFTCYGQSMPHIARFNENGSLDLSFNIGSGFSSSAHTLLVLPDSRILVGGTFMVFNGEFCGNLALLTPQGPRDPSMNTNPGFGAGMVLALLLQPDGKLLVGGEFQWHNGQPASCLIRLNMDGTRDPSFTSPIYPYARVKTIDRQADGMLLIGGEYVSSMYNPNVPGPNRITRIHPNGPRDDDFPLGEGAGTGSEPTAYVSDITVQADGRILVGGFFGSFHNPAETQYRHLIRLLPEATTGIAEHSSVQTLQVAMDDATGELLLWNPFPLAQALTLRMHVASGQLVLERRLQAMHEGPQRLAHELPSGVYVLSLEAAGQRAVARVVLP